MNTDWLEEKEFPKAEGREKMIELQLKRLIEKLKKEYPTGESWLKTPLEKKKIIESSQLKDFAYILPWAIERGLMKNVKFRKKILDYYGHAYKFDANFSKLCIDYAKHYQFITDDEFRKAKEIFSGKGYVGAMAKICITLNKSFKELTDKDLKNSDIDWAFTQKHVTKNSIQKIRFAFGYTNKKTITSRYKQNFVDKLAAKFPKFEKPIRDYQKYLKAADFKKGTMTRKNWSLSVFLPFLEEMSDKQMIQFSSFDRTDFWKYYNYLVTKYKKSSTIYHAIRELSLFIEWGLNVFPEFPTVLDFPDKLAKKLNRASEKESANSDGLAFPIEGLAERIIEECYNFVPRSEKESLCRDFWLIAGSCPVRFDFIHNLSVDCLKPMINNDNFMGLTSEYRDKAGNIHGHYPILDPIGIEVVKRLKKRCIEKGFRPITNPGNKLTYIHLFQEDEVNGLISGTPIRRFLHEEILPKIKEIKDYKIQNEGKSFNIGAHGFRHYLATFVQVKTRNIKATQFVLGHHEQKITEAYLKSKISRNTLVSSIIDGYEKKELSGKFYLRIIEMWSDPSIEDSRLFDALTSEMEFSTFLKQYGRKRDMGWCMTEESCESYYRCWGCHHFILRREEIEEAITLLAKLFLRHRDLVQNSKDYTDDNPIAADSIKKLALVQRRLTDLGVEPEKVWEMVQLKLSDKDIREALKDGNASVTA
ncbi:hypothetical protein [Neobacillus cucumis]|uniref:hypothetical protein n=1 Tax=Neobacillus cucumis TaxID=1740721 RepID=UPI001EF956E6|nr:hypothetical protein [Neobacillus cucumis]MBM7654573.1 hypothetical protein [Neobacillus cucumis]